MAADFERRAAIVKQRSSSEFRAVREDPYSRDIDVLRSDMKRRTSDTIRPLEGDPVGENFPLEVQRQIVDLVATARRDRVDFHRLYREFLEGAAAEPLFVCLSIRLTGRPLLWRGTEWKVKFCREETLMEKNPRLIIHRPDSDHLNDGSPLEEELFLVDVLAHLKM